MAATTSTNGLRLVDPDQNRDVIPFERRGGQRRKVAGRVTAIQAEPSDGEDMGRTRICSLVLRDMSETGLGATSQEPLAPGAGITVFFPPHGPERGFDLCGRVIRCTQHHAVYEIGIQFPSRIMAA